MLHTSPAASNESTASNRSPIRKASCHSELRKLSALILLISLITAHVFGIAQTKEKEKRGIVGPSTPNPSAISTTSGNPANRPQLILQTGHTRSVNTVAFSPDNRWLASGGKDNVIKIWELATGNILRTLYGHTANVNALAVSPDGKLLASGSGDINDPRDLRAFIRGGVVGGLADNTVRIWTVQTGQQVAVLRGHLLPVVAIAFSNEGHSLTSVSGDVIKVWDVSAGTEMRSQRTQYGKSGMEKFDSFSLFGGGGKEQKQQQERLRNLKQSASRIEVSPNGQLAAVGQPDKAVQLYDAQTGSELRELNFKAIPEAENSSLAFSVDARLVAFAKTADTVTVQETSTGRELYSVKTGPSKSPQRVQFSADGRFMITASDNSAGAALKLWDAASGQLIRDLKTSGDQLLAPRVLCFNRDGNQIAVVTRGSKVIRIFDSTTGKEISTLQTGTVVDATPAEREAFIKTIDSKTMATLEKRDITTPEEIVDAVDAMAAFASEKPVAGSAVSFSVDGRSLISNHMLLKSLKSEVWDTTAGMLVSDNNNLSLANRGKPFFSPDGRFRAAPFLPPQGFRKPSFGEMMVPMSNAFKDVYKQKIDLYDGNSDKRLRELEAGNAPEMGIVPASGFSFDSKLIAMTGFEKKERSLLIYETETGRRVNTLQLKEDDQSGAMTTLCLSADERLLAAVYATKTDIVEVSSGKVIRTLPHAGRIVSVSFSPDGRFIVALGENNEMYLWDASSGEELATLVNLGSALKSRGNDWLVVTPDGLFDGSPAAWKQMLWQFGGNTFDVTPAETFFNEFYYPGLLAELIAGKKPRAPKDISQLDRRQPELKVMSASGTNTTERKLNLKIEVTEKPSDRDHASGSGARDVRLFRNGSLVKVWRGDVLKGQTSTTLEADVTIVAGENQFTAYAFNHDNVKSRDATLNVLGAPGLRRDATAYVLSIGVNAYSNEQFNLKYAVADASVFGEEMQRAQRQIGTYQHIEVASLLDAQATKANILLALKLLSGTLEAPPPDAPAVLQKLKAIQPEDALFIYFAGHGTAQKQRFYLLPHDLGYTGERKDLDPAGLQLILDHGISDEELERAVEGLDANKLLMIIDACNSGQALEAEEQRRGPMNSKGLAQLAYEKGMYILTAAQSYQAAQEVSELGHGLLTYVLVEEGLKKSAADTEPKDGEVWVREWFDYASTRVPSMQLEKMKKARGVGVTLSFVEGGENVAGHITQTPRVFYRREPEAKPLIVARVVN
jgi:WD40 repeat protein